MFIKDYRNRTCTFLQRLFGKAQCKWQRVKHFDAEVKEGYVTLGNGYVCKKCGARKTECDSEIIARAVHDSDVKKPGYWVEGKGE